MTPAAAGLATISGRLAAPIASAESLGILFDYSAGVLKDADIKAAGALGAIRYVSDRRPNAQWMLGKPIQLPEARDLYQAGLKIVSNYQFGKQDTADWLGGQAAGVTRQAGMGIAHCRRRSGECAHVRLDRRQPHARAVQAAG